MSNAAAKKSPTAVILTLFYLLTVAASFIVMLMTADDTPISGIFLVLVTLPWSFMLTWVQETMNLNLSSFTTGIFLTAGGLLNSCILYILISFAACRFRR